MTQSSETYFEIFGSGDLIRVEPYQAIKYGQYVADFMTTDFELLKRDFKKLDKDFNATANFEPLEGELKLNIYGDGLGHFEVKCVAQD